MKEIIITIYYILSHLFIIFWVFIVPILGIMTMAFILYYFKIFIFLFILDIIIYSLILKLNILLLKHSSDLMENIKVTPEETKRIYFYTKYIVLLIILHCCLTFILTNFPIPF